MTDDKLLRLSVILSPRGPIPVSRSTWWAHVGSRYPKPVRLGARAVAWRASDIAALVAKGVGDA
ncbi:helix-turn-helix transcriptional regulator [Xanthobacter versatilis]|uniref:helix-turn-helix transcriptional regulator n=1 Tax=Xanthobacter autotrophicus (strain ATCC BAA-1158 / Py2) TaxID=78245 RepID=UPI00372BCA16